MAFVIVLDALGFMARTLRDFNQLIKRPNGIILVTGPTGSGKTTTLYGARDKINSPDKKIITVEDPIEYQLEGGQPDTGEADDRAQFHQHLEATSCGRTRTWS
jgi:type II secretory ATPase GspE/PulE/Tfp pilus assembly ATPase PilB-like protein